MYFFMYYICDGERRPGLAIRGVKRASTPLLPLLTCVRSVSLTSLWRMPAGAVLHRGGSTSICIPSTVGPYSHTSSGSCMRRSSLCDVPAWTSSADCIAAICQRPSLTRDLVPADAAPLARVDGRPCQLRAAFGPFSYSSRRQSRF